MDWKKIAGIADGVLVAALIALGRGYPPWQAWTDPLAGVIGAIGSALGVSAAAGKKS